VILTGPAGAAAGLAAAAGAAVVGAGAVVGAAAPAAGLAADESAAARDHRGGAEGSERADAPEEMSPTEHARHPSFPHPMVVAFEAAPLYSMAE
jgi:hypothetical protein